MSTAAAPMGRPGSNWAGNHRYRAVALAEPRSVDELRRIVRAAHSVRPLGTRHSFNDIADTTGLLLSTAELPGRISIDADRASVTVGPGVRYGDLARRLEARGWALANMASLPHISVAGSVSTGTHGSGDANRTLASAVSEFEMVLADGELRRLSREDSDFDGAVVGLGALGVITELTLDIEPSYQVEQTVYEGVTVEGSVELSALTGLGYSVSLFTTFRRPGRFHQLWLKRRVDRDAPAPRLLAGAAPAREPRHPLAGMSAEHCTEQLGVPGPWLERLPHFKLGFTPSNGDELQSEYLVPREHATDAFAALCGLGDRIAGLVQACEVRTVAADDFWLSPAYGRDVVAFHFTWLNRQPEVEALLPDLEAALAPFSARPHWAKLFALEVDTLTERYPRLEEFRSLARRYDPAGTFRNEFLTRTIGL